jgi:hypothetical protein
MRTELREILERVESLYDDSRKEAYGLWFRGQRSAKWPLRSTLHRRVEIQFEAMGDPTAAPQDRQGLLREEYKSAFYLFKTDGLLLLDPYERTDWGIAFSMQHHGIPTRLLDWTESFACALFFAQADREKDEDAAIFALKADQLNKVSTGREGLISIIEDQGVKTSIELAKWLPAYVPTGTDSPLSTIAVLPPRSNPRMLAQRATFTVCGDSFSPLEDEYSSVITKIVLPATLFAEVESFIELLGIGPYSYFPDLEGLAMRFREKSRFELRHMRRMLGKKTP